MRRSIWNWLFIIASFSLGLMFLILVYQESSPEWKRYQRRYYGRLARITQEPARAQTPLKVLQIYLPEFRKTERCITCHVGVENPKMAGQPPPYGMHTDLGIPGFLAKHPFSEIGCTVCHQGQGHATTKEAAHGHVKHWMEPLLDKDLTISTCAKCHGNFFSLKGVERLVPGKQTFDEAGCIGCHALNGSGNQIGPELSDTGNKSEDELDFRYIQGPHTVTNWIYDHFKDPQRVSPGDPAQGVSETPMPNYELPHEEARRLTAVILSFSAAKGKDSEVIPYQWKVPAGPPKPEPSYANAVQRGEALFQKFGCVGCHGNGAQGGVRNPNMDQSEEVPPLIYVSEGFTKEELMQTIRDGRYPARSDPNGPQPPLWMPAWKGKLTEEEIDAVAEYLLSLYPREMEENPPVSTDDHSQK